MAYLWMLWWNLIMAVILTSCIVGQIFYSFCLILYFNIPTRIWRFSLVCIQTLSWVWTKHELVYKQKNILIDSAKYNCWYTNFLHYFTIYRWSFEICEVSLTHVSFVYMVQVCFNVYDLPNQPWCVHLLGMFNARIDVILLTRRGENTRFIYNVRFVNKFQANFHAF